ncbi:hypothetical protein FFLO_02946 [Filobasidium floriforme]|uniref:CAP-Gly domain-containing protein n=1 Tax=Filobasidium floriforme TaxID=5210 RepID=A0A8K0JLQ3_9TREE|nr:hypothetical protein FFLO_02946 [Filobasidium floriforme]
MEPPYEISTRYLHRATSQPCTLRYIGPVTTQTTNTQTEAERDRIWLGVEWDDPARGKHSGTHLGVKYFTSRVDGAASFLRWKPKDASKAREGTNGTADNGEMLWRGRTLLQAIKDRYLDTDLPDMEQPVETTNDHSLVLGSSNSRIQVTVPNLNKVTSKFADLGRLTHLGLDGMWVYGLKAQGEGNDLDMNMLDRLKSVKSLDLSGNLISRWQDLADIIRVLPMLTGLKLSHSRLPQPESSLDGVVGTAFRNITDLTIRNSLVSWSDVTLLSSSFSNLERLDIAVNPLCSGRQEGRKATSGFVNLRELVAGDCDISAWEDVVDMFGSLPALERLDISVNPIHSVPNNSSSVSSRAVFQRLQELVIKETTLDDWKDLGNLASWFDHEPVVLKSLKISSRVDDEGEVQERSSPDRQRLSGTRADRAGLVARFRGLGELNSSPVTKAEREEAAKIAQSLQAQPRQDVKVQINDATVISKPVQNSLKSKMIDLKLVFPDSPLDQASTLPQTISVLPSATLKILMIKLKKAAGSALATNAFHLEYQGGKLGDDDMNIKLSDLGLREGDEVIVRTE